MPSKQPRRLEVRSDLRFEFFGPNYIYYHVCLDCFDLLLNFDRKKEEEERRTFNSARPVGFTTGKNEKQNFPEYHSVLMNNSDLTLRSECLSVSLTTALCIVGSHCPGNFNFLKWLLNKCGRHWP